MGRMVVLTLIGLFPVALPAVTVQVPLTGVVTVTRSTQFAVGDSFQLVFSYETNVSGDCPTTPDFSGANIYRCTNAVTTSSATIGDDAFTFPPSVSFPPPYVGKTSSLQVTDTAQVAPGGRDEFQGYVALQPTSSIAYPVLAFYLFDRTRTASSSPPRLPTSWGAASAGAYQELTFALSDVGPTDPPGSGGPLVEGIISPIPVPAAVWLFGSALGVLGWLQRKSHTCHHGGARDPKRRFSR